MISYDALCCACRKDFASSSMAVMYVPFCSSGRARWAIASRRSCSGAMAGASESAATRRSKRPVECLKRGERGPSRGTPATWRMPRMPRRMKSQSGKPESPRRRTSSESRGQPRAAPVSHVGSVSARMACGMLTVVGRQDGEQEEQLGRVVRDLRDEGQGGPGGGLVVHDGDGLVVLPHVRAEVGEVQARDGEEGAHDVVAGEAHLDDGHAVELPDGLRTASAVSRISLDLVLVVGLPGPLRASRAWWWCSCAAAPGPSC